MQVQARNFSLALDSKLNFFSEPLEQFDPMIIEHIIIGCDIIILFLLWLWINRECFQPQLLTITLVGFSFSFYIARSLQISTTGIGSASHLETSVSKSPSDTGWLLKLQLWFFMCVLWCALELPEMQTEAQAP